LIHPILSLPKMGKLLDYIGNKFGLSGIFIIPVIGLSIAAITLFPDSSEGTRIARGFCFFLLGYLIWQRESWWLTIKTYRRLALVLSLISYFGLLYYYHFFFLVRTEPLNGIYAVLETSLLLANRWVWVLAILGYAYAYLNKPSALVSYLSQAIFPGYLLHQSILIVAAFILTPLKLGPVFEAFWVISITILLCFFVYELFKRIDIMRPLVGITSKSNEEEQSFINKAFMMIGWLLIFPLGCLILL
jgi:surface polysaccharide O-acyltransferase-like enzyme